MFQTTQATENDHGLGNQHQHRRLAGDPRQIGAMGPSKAHHAIADDKFEMVLEKGGQEHAERAAKAERKRLKTVPHDVLVDRAFELVEANDTCDNGGYGYWVDREGFHKVWLN